MLPSISHPLGQISLIHHPIHFSRSQYSQIQLQVILTIIFLVAFREQSQKELLNILKNVILALEFFLFFCSYEIQLRLRDLELRFDVGQLTVLFILILITFTVTALNIEFASV